MVNFMKLLKIITFVCFLLTIIGGFRYYNLKTSYKYEVDLMETHIKIDTEDDVEKSEKLEALKLKEQKINSQIKVTKMVTMVLAVLTVIFLSFLVYKIRE